MLWTLFVVLLLAWLVCIIALKTVSIAIHLLLVLAAIILITRLIGGRGKRS